ncbi:MAG: hypothetical protein GY937_23990 [bacterium]|nr:hypothetical protein [bacterium]
MAASPRRPGPAKMSAVFHEAAFFDPGPDLKDLGLETLILGACLMGDMRWPGTELFWSPANAHIAAYQATSEGEPNFAEIRNSAPEWMRPHVTRSLIDAVDSYAGPWMLDRYLEILRSLAYLRRVFSTADDMAAALRKSRADDVLVGASEWLREVIG